MRVAAAGGTLDEDGADEDGADEDGADEDGADEDGAGGHGENGAGLVLRRTVSASGRSRAHVGGAASPVAVLAELAESLVVVHGQSDQLRLTRPGRQREALDSYAGIDRSDYEQAYAAWRHAGEQLAERSERAGELRREADLLAHGLADIEAADPQPGEDADLTALAGRLAHADALRLARTRRARRVARRCRRPDRRRRRRQQPARGRPPRTRPERRRRPGTRRARRPAAGTVGAGRRPRRGIRRLRGRARHRPGPPRPGRGPASCAGCARAQVRRRGRPRSRVRAALGAAGLRSIGRRRRLGRGDRCVARAA